MLTPLVLEQMREIARGRLAPGRMQELYEEFCHRAGPLEAYGALLEKLIGTEELAAQTPATLLTELRFVMERLRAPLERAGGGVR